MKFTPHPYQQYCIDYLLSHKAAGLFLDMGLGKTAISLTAADELLDRCEVSKVLVIAPLRVAQDTWSRESDKWDHLRHLRISKILGTERQRERAIDADADIYVINRENVPWLVSLWGASWPYQLVIVDELSSFKSPSAARFKALRKIRPLIQWVWGLTGTPAPNGLIDLWAQIYLLDRGERLGRTVGAYRREYFTPGAGNGYITYNWKPRKETPGKIEERLSDLCVSMKACDYLELPERVDVELPVELDEKAQAAYDTLERDAVLPLSEEAVIDAGTAAVVTGKLLQIANGAVYDAAGTVQHIHDAKLDALEDVIEAANGQQVLVFYAYQHDVDRIQKRLNRLSGIKMAKLSGPAEIEAWNRGEIQVLLAHPAAAGYGLNLQDGGCHSVCWFGLTWNLELYQQANARIYRQGVQGSHVTITHLLAKGTVDEDVMHVLSSKASTQDSFIEALKARIEKYGRVK